MHLQLGTAIQNTDTALGKAVDAFGTKLLGLTNQVASNQLKFEIGLGEITGVVHDWKTVADADRKLLHQQVASMEHDLHKAIIRAIQVGEAKMKAVLERALINASTVKKAMLGEISERVERMADEVFKAVLDNRGKVADNYLALKAYCGANGDAIIDYTTRGEGKGLFSLGDLMTVVATLAEYRTQPAENMGAGGDTVPAIFQGDDIPVSSSLSKSNGLVNEWSRALSTVRERWSYGLGRYLLNKVEHAMQHEGVLSVGHVSERDGEHVFINARSIGLSNKLSDFDKLAVKTVDYQQFLAHLTAKLPKTLIVPEKKHFYVPAPEYDGK